MHERSVDGNSLFLFGSQYGSQVDRIFHRFYKFFPAIDITGIVDFTYSDKDVRESNASAHEAATDRNTIFRAGT